MNIQAKASDNVGVSKMELYIDGTLTLVKNASSITWSWNTFRVAKGQHAISVRAYDAAGNVGVRSITVNR